ncbi:helix-turn-helix transcriptional regulator [Phycicoccus sonneratiae]|uniref:Helix-turn-helix transcriptional regulator n=1 Tax=Phycicoccus sonneratiae TaxID=2807628 RepID=A0ABS2CG98_9MICO|nr:helix-turn-helix transcriptional regulator [Phycicoccus sonneraticus]MBM6398896.1 helix-turn-helix transcriptional regulator [Phycicoccus sonneraticus]
MPGPAVAAFLAALPPLLQRPGGPFRWLGERSGLPRVFAELEAGTRHSLWNMQVQLAPSFSRQTRGLDHTTRARGVDERMVHERRGAANNPLLTSFDPDVRLAPVATQLMVLDDRRVLVPGLPGSPTTWSAYLSDDPEVVALARAAFLETWESAVPWQEVGLRPPLPPRRFEVALDLLAGWSDRAIAERLGIGERTVSGEVRAIVDWLGARNRTHAVAMLVGAA